jgi:hypothetical protein
MANGKTWNQNTRLYESIDFDRQPEVKAENLPISHVIFCSCLNPIRGEDRTNGHSCKYCLKKIKER